MASSEIGLLEFKEIKYDTLKSIDAVAKEVIDFAKGFKTWVFEGPMGAGKTTLIKAICLSLGVVDNVSSPSYSLVNEYKISPSGKIYHFDFYRINSETEATDLGFEEYIYSNNLCLIEWPSKVASLLPDSYIKILMEVTGQDSRKISLSKLGSYHTIY